MRILLCVGMLVGSLSPVRGQSVCPAPNNTESAGFWELLGCRVVVRPGELPTVGERVGIRCPVHVNQAEAPNRFLNTPHFYCFSRRSGSVSVAGVTDVRTRVETLPCFDGNDDDFVLTPRVPGTHHFLAAVQDWTGRTAYAFFSFPVVRAPDVSVEVQTGVADAVLLETTLLGEDGRFSEHTALLFEDSVLELPIGSTLRLTPLVVKVPRGKCLGVHAALQTPAGIPVSAFFPHSGYRAATDLHLESVESVFLDSEKGGCLFPRNRLVVQ